MWDWRYVQQIDKISYSNCKLYQWDHSQMQPTFAYSQPSSCNYSSNRSMTMNNSVVEWNWELLKYYLSPSHSVVCFWRIYFTLLKNKNSLRVQSYLIHASELVIFYQYKSSYSHQRFYLSSYSSTSFDHWWTDVPIYYILLFFEKELAVHFMKQD